ncbi:sterigmatocystin biosynthesis P450 monooxygenase StcS [Byssothecium circinans]|uniref:Sterigmatocystin biosynthesis P450 monooxygenase StcS n=1 Tax=Byssothecium circinans TaxID=147558 RepID=A0A6A5TYU3_9PLEO|nr:sterigmatocystin biosynthesis P450 monooxygenase StcS [Byssothecium circinans]
MPATTSILVALLVGLGTALGTFFTKLYRARMLVVDRQRRGLPVAPNHSFLFGHLIYLKSVLDRLPKDAHYEYAFATIAREEFSENGAFYLDLWPMSGLFLAVVSPQIATQITQGNPPLTNDRPKLLRRFMKPFTGGLTIFDLDEAEWKPWRTVFNKGFHSDRLMSLVPGMVEETMVYVESLKALADKAEMCFLDPITLRYTIDVIGKTVLNTSLGSQKGYNALADGMLGQTRWHNPNAEINPFSQFDFVRKLIHWKNGGQMDKYIGAELDKRYEEYKASPNGESSKSASVIDLVLRAYISGNESSKSPPRQLDATFRAMAIRQVRLFIFAGYDSTASVICYCFHYLSKTPNVLGRLRAEHDQVLGLDPASAASALCKDPRLVNNLPYTLAVIKEVMRMFPPAGTTRAGKPGVSTTDDAGNLCPTDDAILWILHVEMHRSPKYWMQPDDFLPERWLVGPQHELYPRPGAWRPFELGPRNCIGQALVLVELRVILACLIRTFDISPAYDEWDVRHPSNGIKLYRGERAYQVEQGAAHPNAGYPCRIKLAIR